MCCLFGMIDRGGCFSARQKSRMCSILATECEVRGADATGISYYSGGKLRIYKRPLPARRMHFRIPGDARIVMGHTRLTTQGSEKRNCNNHPFRGEAGGASFALAHNGVLHNDRSLRRMMPLPETNIETDSYVAVQLIEQKRALSFDSLKYMAEEVEGSFAFTVLDERDDLYFVKGDNPLCLYYFSKLDLYLYASTEEILLRAISKLRLPFGRSTQIPVECGEILRIDAQGRLARGHFDASRLFRARFRYEDDISTLVYETETPEQEYVRELKMVAATYGCAPEVIHALLREGLTTDELEEMLYCGEL